MTDWMESTYIFAFWMGILSAASLPLGALTILFWKPSEKTVAWLMAFGAGALLFALTVDLFAPAIHKELYWQVSLGAVMGSLIYLYLNQSLNAKGGFLRKTGTTIQFLRQRQKKEQMEFLQSINRLSFLQNLPEKDKLALLDLIEIRHFGPNEVIYQHGDLHDAFYLIRKGDVKLEDPDKQLKTFLDLDETDAFGRMAFLSRMPNATQAVTRTDVEVWKINRQAFMQLMQSSDDLLLELKRFYLGRYPKFAEKLDQASHYNEEMIHYLIHRHNFTHEEAEKHVQWIMHQLIHDKRLVRIVKHTPNIPLTSQFFKECESFKLFEGLSDDLVNSIVAAFKYHELRAGQGIYKNHSNGDQLYLLASGEVELLLPKDKTGEPRTIGAKHFFGKRAFILGGKRVSTAIAITRIGFWTLSRKDFECLLFEYPELKERYEAYLESKNISDYLILDQKIKPSEAQQWIRSSVKHLVPGKLPDLKSISGVPMHPAAPYMAIWLGIFLDGIPESFTIGAQITSENLLSMSLIAGLFLSNYPEALSSSASMQLQGIRFRGIFIAWFSLMILTGIGAFLGSIFLSGASETTFAIISGLAAGAMLTVIAETMLPESFYKAGSIIGFVTLMGFLAAMTFKAFDSV